MRNEDWASRSKAKAKAKAKLKRKKREPLYINFFQYHFRKEYLDDIREGREQALEQLKKVQKKFEVLKLLGLYNVWVKLLLNLKKKN